MHRESKALVGWSLSTGFTGSDSLIVSYQCNQSTLKDLSKYFHQYSVITESHLGSSGLTSPELNALMREAVFKGFMQTQMNT